MTTFPTDHLVTTALEELLDQAQRQLNLATNEGADKDERAFWRRQRNAFVNAEADWLGGRRPIETPTGYLLPSASRPGAYHRAWRAGDVWLCSCEAGEAGLFHRHTALICALERATDLADYADDPGPAGEEPQYSGISGELASQPSYTVGDVTYSRAVAEIDELFA